MEFITRTTRIVPNAAAQRRLESTLVHLSNHWLPVNPVSLGAVQNRLLSGDYEQDRGQLLVDLQADLPLLSHCLKYLRAQIPDSDTLIDPYRDLLSIDYNNLQRMLLVKANAISTHRFANAGKVRADLTRQSVVAGSAAFIIASEVAVETGELQPSDAAYCTLLRQLGTQLIAWNYPSVLSSATRTGRGDSHAISAYLKQVIGISPEQISRHFAKRWLLEPDFAESINQDRSQKFDSPSLMIPSPITPNPMTTVCEFGELYSKMQSANTRKSAEKEWQKRENEFLRLAPRLKYQELQQAVEEETGAALEQIDQALTKRASISVPLTLTENAKAIAPAQPRSFDANQFLKRCPAHIQSLFRGVYEEIRSTGPSVEALQSLVSKAIPASGFTSGVIYMLDPIRAELVPAAKIGDHRRVLNSKIAPLVKQTALDAFNSETPLRKEEISDDGMHLEHVCSAFGDATKPGVLLLEIDRYADLDDSQNSTLYFKAIRQCLHDCLDVNR